MKWRDTAATALILNVTTNARCANTIWNCTYRSKLARIVETTTKPFTIVSSMWRVRELAKRNRSWDIKLPKRDIGRRSKMMAITRQRNPRLEWRKNATIPSWSPTMTPNPKETICPSTNGCWRNQPSPWEKSRSRSQALLRRKTSCMPSQSCWLHQPMGTTQAAWWEWSKTSGKEPPTG